MLNSNIHLDDKYPLDKKEAAPIETFDEARIELSFLKNSTFKDQAYNAEANIQTPDVVSLFMDEAA